MLGTLNFSKFSDVRIWIICCNLRIQSIGRSALQVRRVMRRSWGRQARALASLTRSPLIVFDNAVKAKQKARAAVAENADDFDYLRDELASRVVDRICDMSRTFPRGLDLFSGSCHVLKAVVEAENKPGLQSLALVDVHPVVLSRARSKSADLSSKVDVDTSEQFVFREGEPLASSIRDQSLDIIVSSGGLHWVNDLPGIFQQVNRLLRPDGLFIAAMYGGETLRELRISMQMAEEEIFSGISPHISPMVQSRDVASLLTGANFKLTTIDVDEIRVPFRDMRAVMKHLKGMGESNAVAARRPHYGRKAFSRAAEIYREMFGYTDERGRSCVQATFQIVHMVGWSPADSSQQPQPLPRGSAKASFADVGKATSTTDK